jgi:hypothetical protein
MSDKDPGMAIVEKALEGLIEHYDNVQIFANRRNADGDMQYTQMGRGDWYSRYRQVRCWIIREDEKTRLDR